VLLDCSRPFSAGKLKGRIGKIVQLPRTLPEEFCPYGRAQRSIRPCRPQAPTSRTERTRPEWSLSSRASSRSTTPQSAGITVLSTSSPVAVGNSAYPRVHSSRVLRRPPQPFGRPVELKLNVIGNNVRHIVSVIGWVNLERTLNAHAMLLCPRTGQTRAMNALSQ